MQKIDLENANFSMAYNFINDSNQAVFLTGKAGTGKTTFLKYIRENCFKNLAVVAPTGVAAINAGGVTIHSFFQLPFSPYLPTSNNPIHSQPVNGRQKLLDKLKLTNERKEVIQRLELLIIDEISMVRCDVLDAIDAVLRHVRKNYAKPFGGVQMLYIGDMYQLPPVVNSEEWKILSTVYSNQYFFSSYAIVSQPPIFIELTKVFRQSDQSFIELLNKVRNNEMKEQDFALLHSRYSANFQPTEGFITLTSHNSKADAINKEALENLETSLFSFHATVEAEFNEKSYPAPELLNIKCGAQVMFIKNDTEKIRRYYNGKIGIVNKIEEDKIWVDCKSTESSQLIEVRKETWRNIKYSINPKTQQVEEQELGSFIQFPLRLAWAITIHKSQGLTFERAIIDAGNAFSPGQVYVALSRCTSLEGIILKSMIAEKSLLSDERIRQFSARQQSLSEQEKRLSNAIREYQQQTIATIFDFSAMSQQVSTLIRYSKESNAFANSLDAWLSEMKVQFDNYNGHSTKFLLHLQSLFGNGELPEKDAAISDRLIKAGDWFVTELMKTKLAILNSPASTANRPFANGFSEKLEMIFNSVCYTIHILDCCRNGFTIEKYRQRRDCFTKEGWFMNVYTGSNAEDSKDILYPELYEALRARRELFSTEKRLAVYLVCTNQSLEQMTNFLPRSLDALKKIRGFGKIKLKEFGSEFISVINTYCEAHGLVSNIETILSKKIKPGKKRAIDSNTKQLSYDLFLIGKTISEIASSRNLVKSTIEGHLAHFIENGSLPIDKLLDENKRSTICIALLQTKIGSFNEIREILPEITYAEFKWVKAWQKLMQVEVV